MAYVFWICLALILYTYFGYPLLLVFLARLRPSLKFEAAPAPEALPAVTLLIAAFNEATLIARKLENSLELDYPAEKLQILVANDCSDDGTTGIVSGFAARGVEQCHTPQRRGKMGNVNHAIAQARGEIVVFSDATNLYAANALKELVAPFANPRVGMVGGAHTIVRGDGPLGDSEGLYWRYEAGILTLESRLSSCTAMPGDMLAIRRELYLRPPDHIINDDFFMAMCMIKSGRRVFFNPRARCFERVSPTARDEVVRRTRMIAGRYQALSLAATLLPWKRPLIVWQVISHKFMRPLVPFAMIGALLANLGVVIWPNGAATVSFWRLGTPWAGILLAGQGVFYLVAWIGHHIEHRRGAWALFYLPAFLVNSNWAAVLGLSRFLFRRQASQWQKVSRRSLEK